MKIQDGKGSGAEAEVSAATNRLQVDAESNPREFYISRDDGQAFHYTSSYNATTGAVVISIRNTSKTKNLFIGEVVCSNDTNTGWNIYLNNGVDSGTTIPAVNLNATSANAAESDALGNAAVTLGTANTNTGLVSCFYTDAFNAHQIELKDSVILGTNDSVNVELFGATLGSCTIAITVDGHFE
jgi:hypothetical protein